VANIHNWVFFICKEEKYVICRKIDGTGDHCAKWNKLDSEKQTCFLSYAESRFIKWCENIRNNLWDGGASGKGRKTREDDGEDECDQRKLYTSMNIS
jgi:hypothetical protein